MRNIYDEGPDGYSEAQAMYIAVRGAGELRQSLIAFSCDGPRGRTVEFSDVLPILTMRAPGIFQAFLFACERQKINCEVVDVRGLPGFVVSLQ